MWPLAAGGTAPSVVSEVVLRFKGVNQLCQRKKEQDTLLSNNEIMCVFNVHLINALLVKPVCRMPLSSSQHCFKN